MDNRGLLMLILVLVVAVVCMLVIEDTANTRTPVEKISDSVNEVTEEIKDEIDDNTTAPNP